MEHSFILKSVARTEQWAPWYPEAEIKLLFLSYSDDEDGGQWLWWPGS